MFTINTIDIIADKEREKKRKKGKSTKILNFTFILFNVNISINIAYILFKFDMFILDVTLERTISQMFYLGPRTYVM